MYMFKNLIILIFIFFGKCCFLEIKYYLVWIFILLVDEGSCFNVLILCNKRLNFKVYLMKGILYV